MYVPLHSLDAGANAYAIDDDNIPFGDAVKLDGSIDWENAYDFDPCDEDVEFVAHRCDKVMQAKALHAEHFSVVFVK